MGGWVLPARRAQELVETEGSWENLEASFHFDVNGHLSEPVVPGLRPKRRGRGRVGGTQLSAYFISATVIMVDCR